MESMAVRHGSYPSRNAYLARVRGLLEEDVEG